MRVPIAAIFKSAGSWQIPWGGLFNNSLLFANTLESSLHLAKILHPLGKLKGALLVVLLGNSRLEALFQVSKVFEDFLLLLLGIVSQFIKEVACRLVGRCARIIQKGR